jgi:hypothetical protein
VTPEDLLNLISTLSREQQDSVEQFIRFLKKESLAHAAFHAALDEFVREHPNLLRRLAL